MGLTISCVVSRGDMFKVASRQADLESRHLLVEAEVRTRTESLELEHTSRLNAESMATHVLQCSADPLIVSLEEGGGTESQSIDLRSAIDGAHTENLSSEVPRAIEQTLEGVERVRKFVQSMKEFSHPGSERMTQIDLNSAIQSTVVVATNEWMYVADMKLDLCEDLPPVRCFPGEINQVVLNLIVNGAHAIIDANGEGQGKGTITVSTRRDGEYVEICVGDTGTGIPEAIQDKVFGQFFTTKEVGKGTGQGLSIAHRIVVQKHGGTIGFESKVGRGTTMIVRLPLAGAAVEASLSETLPQVTL